MATDSNEDMVEEDTETIGKDLDMCTTQISFMNVAMKNKDTLKTQMIICVKLSMISVTFQDCTL